MSDERVTELNALVESAATESEAVSVCLAAGVDQATAEKLAGWKFGTFSGDVKPT